MTTQRMPMPPDPSFWDELQAAWYPWLGTPEGWAEIMAQREPEQRQMGTGPC